MEKLLSDIVTHRWEWVGKSEGEEEPELEMLPLHAPAYEENLDNRFVFNCDGEHLLERCGHSMDIGRAELDVKDIKCPVCWKEYFHDTNENLLLTDKQDYLNSWFCTEDEGYISPPLVAPKIEVKNQLKLKLEPLTV